MHNVLAILALTGSAFGHLNLLSPLALGAEDNEINFPIGCCGTGGEGPNKEAVASAVPEGPRGCRGHQDKFDTANFEVTWKAGEKATFKLDPNNKNGLSSTHWGGSCQVGFSFDKLETTTVATSYPGACPHREDGSDQSFDFVVPSDIPSGKALFVWTFNNREGEFFESCAPVIIEGGSGAGSSSNSTTPQEPASSKAPTSSKAPSGSKPSKTPTAAKPSKTTTAEQSIQTSPNEQPEEPTEEPTEEQPVEEEAEEPAEGEPEACTGRHCRSTWSQRDTRKRALTWATRGPMLFNDFPGADCFSQAFQDEKHDTELDYPNPGDVVKGDGEYPLALPSGAACGV